MDIKLIAGPVIGGIIGYFTNYIAVKMLFRPLKPIKIGNYTLPFTPGIIPKGKSRIAKAIGNAVGQSLLTKDTLQESLLSEEMKNKLRIDVKAFINHQSENNNTVKEQSLAFVKEEEYENLLDAAEHKITDTIVKNLEEMDVGTIIAREGTKAIKEKVGGSFIGMMLNDSLIESMTGPIVDAINAYINENGQIIVGAKVEKELERFSNSQIKDIITSLNELDVVEIFMRCYESLIENTLDKLVANIDIASIVEKKIDEMDVLELEELILSVMKKELGAIVNLGAVIGFILGLFNLIFK